jgi:nuclear pore complex protein Nup155
VLLGLCVGSKPTSSDPYAELELQQLPLYTLPSDNVIITCCASTPAGRIFLGGSDGHLYELTYAASDSWRHKRCQKVGAAAGCGLL